MATFGLVHGTTAGGWVWRDVTPILKAAGHEVYTPTLTGLGERVHLLSRDVGLDTHIMDVVNVLIYEDLNDVILVGHSYGGMVITGVADKVPERLSHLVYFDAHVPQDGESLLDLNSNRRGSEQRVQTQGDGWLVPVSRGPNDPPSKNTPHPYKTWADPVQLEHKKEHSIPCTYVRFTADKQPGSHFERAMQISWQRVQDWGWRLYEIDTVHQILPDPTPKADVLLQLINDLI